MEREDHLQSLDRLLSDCLESKGHAVLLEGSIGSGKTALLRVLIERAEHFDAVPLIADCSRTERTLSFGVVNQLFHSGTWPFGLDDQVGRLLDELTGVSSPGDPECDQMAPEMVRAFDRLSGALRDLAAHSPVVIGIDDVGHADISSLCFLLHLIRRIRSTRILVVLSDDSFHALPHLRFHAELRRQPHFHRLRLAPLSRAGTLRLIAESLGQPAAERLLQEFAAAGGGNPLLLRALIDDHRLSGGGPSAGGYGLALLSCLYRSGSVMLQVVRALAVLGEKTSSAALGKLADVDGAAAEKALHILNAAELLNEGWFRHPIARAVVLDDMSSPERAGLHRRAAQLLHDRGASATTVARQLLGAAHTQPPWAAQVLSEAAEQALLDDERTFALDCLKLAHRSGKEECARAAIRARLAQIEWQVDPSSAIRHLAPLTEAARAGLLCQGDSTVLIRQLGWHGHLDEAVDVLDRLRAAAVGKPGSSEAGLVRDVVTWLAYAHPPLTRGGHLATLPADRPKAAAHMQGEQQLRLAAMLAEALAKGRYSDTIERAQQVLRDVHLHREHPWSEESALLALLLLIEMDKLEEAKYWCDRLIDHTQTPMTHVALAFFAAVRSEVTLRQGELALAARDAQAALSRLTPKAWGVAIGLPLSTLVLATAKSGDYENAKKHLTLPVPDALFQSHYGLRYLHARGRYYLATDQCHAALADFLSCGELVRQWGLDAAVTVPWRTNAAEAWQRLDNKDQARRLLQEQLGQPGADRPRIRGSALRLLAALTPPGRRMSLLTEALDLAEAAGDRFEQAQTLTDLSRAHLANNNKSRARLLLRQAQHVANLYEMKPLIQELLSVSADLGGTQKPADGPDELATLTQSEQRVGALAALGYTNREIGTRLYITPSTVEQHLTRVYRKLKIRQRTDLPPQLWTGIGRTG